MKKLLESNNGLVHAVHISFATNVPSPNTHNNEERPRKRPGYVLSPVC
ncbi:6473_t:CDS:2 [Diversispora eburnea]|uniref:6473_t:CDS:1 n=1 Tax=Diversispora eburnea TaxID=1213867 RepID=A0A9N9BHF3_9GLOM|nr:6473_t:CDS:2 [Diversispora eburnea]